jgi:hypothetical protein
VKWRRPPAGALVAAGLLSGCSAFPGARAAAGRMQLDAFVTLTAPLQVPWLAARAAWAEGAADSGAANLLLPIRLLGHCFAEAATCALHTLDLAAAPIHLVAGNGPAPIYAGCALPLERREPFASRATGELALYDVAGVGGAAIAWWFGTTYVPGIFRFFTGTGGLLAGN